MSSTCSSGVASRSASTGAARQSSSRCASASSIGFRPWANAGRLLYAILDTAVDGYFPLLDQISEDIDSLEDLILDGKGNMVLLREVLNLKRQLLELRRVLGPMRDSANQLLSGGKPRSSTTRRSPTTRTRTTTSSGCSIRSISTVTSWRRPRRPRIGHDQQPEPVVKRLTAVTVLLMVPTLIAGIYGMNSFFMPELSQEVRLLLAGLLGMLIIVLGLASYFRRKGWF